MRFFYVCKVIKSITKNNSFQKKKKKPQRFVNLNSMKFSGAVYEVAED